MELNQKISELDAELKLLKNEVKEVLLDIRESILDYENPFTTVAAAPPTVVEIRQEPTAQTVVAQQEQPAARVEFPEERQGAVERGTDQNPEAQPDRIAEKGGVREEGGTFPTAPGPVEPVPSLATQPPPFSMTEQRTGAGPLDLATIAGLGQWAGSGVTRIGRKRVEAIIQIYRMTGHLMPGLDEVLMELTRLVDGEEPAAPVTMRECIGALVQLDSLVGRSGSSGATLLSFLLDDAEESPHR